MERFFRAVALAGNFYLSDLKDWEEWDPPRVRYRDEVEVAWLTRISPADRRRVATAAELDAALEESASPRAVHLYVSERLTDDARRRWLEMKKKRRPAIRRA
ncbi:MAG TPA: hypothetical protein VJT33_16145 [bacterium]|nr:hypothetical protein [bacterium]